VVQPKLTHLPSISHPSLSFSFSLSLALGTGYGMLRAEEREVERLAQAAARGGPGSAAGKLAQWCEVNGWHNLNQRLLQRSRNAQEVSGAPSPVAFSLPPPHTPSPPLSLPPPPPPRSPQPHA
jgi:hypothetical protein